MSANELVRNSSNSGDAAPERNFALFRMQVSAISFEVRKPDGRVVQGHEPSSPS
jgi:hypothetical protein